MEFLRNWSYNKKLQNKIAHKTSLGTQINGKFVGIVFDYQESKEVTYLKSLMDQYKIDGYLTKLLGYIDEPGDLNRYNFRAFSQKSIGWDGIPENPDIDEFLSRNYDVVFFAIRNYNPAITYIARLTTARVKLATFHPELEKNFDILLDIKSSCRINDIFDQFLMHLKIVSN